MSTRSQAASWKKLGVSSSSGRRNVILASQIEQDEICYRWEAIQLLRAWEQYGWGKVIVGRRGSPTRFQVSPKAIKSLKAEGVALASAGAGGKASTAVVGDGVSSPGTKACQPGPDGGASPPEINGSKLWSHRFQLRDDLQIEFNLPSDITEREAARLGRFVETLPL